MPLERYEDLHDGLVLFVKLDAFYYYLFTSFKSDLTGITHLIHAV